MSPNLVMQSGAAGVWWSGPLRQAVHGGAMSRVFVSCAYRDRAVGRRLARSCTSWATSPSTTGTRLKARPGGTRWSAGSSRAMCSSPWSSPAYVDAQTCRLAAKHAASSGLRVVRVDLGDEEVRGVPPGGGGRAPGALRPRRRHLGGGSARLAPGGARPPIRHRPDPPRERAAAPHGRPTRCWSRWPLRSVADRRRVWSCPGRSAPIAAPVAAPIGRRRRPHRRRQRRPPRRRR